ncbi:MAG: 23S rRNA (adenine(2503)-C(2))-methyltransferase RlmN, partial [Clostridia bacterium]|nr:23S rRNA (adenine(2503)-C(2))-methyltransferase RlmN [Clostridia bacterium]
KYLYKLCDGNIIEGVLMKYKYGNTLCVSTQVGCRMNCAFCASGLDGLIRNLTAGEILGQVIAVNARNAIGEDRGVTNIVLMGSGEPLDNYDNVCKFLTLVSDEKGLNISKRNISLSTCGLCDRIRQLADDGYSPTMTISLHAPNDEMRKEIMPIAKKYSIADIIKAVKYYFEKTGRRIIFEYSMIAGKNDTEDCARQLAGVVKGLACHINLIPLNYVKERGLDGSNKKNIYRFMSVLEKQGVSVTVRRSMGSDIDGACGQLRRKVVNNEDN